MEINSWIGNALKKRRGSASRGLYSYFFQTLLSKMDINAWFRNALKKRRGSASRVYIAISFRHFLWRKWKLIHGVGNRKKTASVGLQGLYTYFLFETLFMEKKKFITGGGEINSFLNEFQGFNFNFNFNSGRCCTYCFFFRFSFLYFGNKH